MKPRAATSRQKRAGAARLPLHRHDCGIQAHAHVGVAGAVDALACARERAATARRLLGTLALPQHERGHAAGCLRGVTGLEQTACDCGWSAVVTDARAFVNRERGL